MTPRRDVMHARHATSAAGASGRHVAGQSAGRTVRQHDLSCSAAFVRSQLPALPVYRNRGRAGVYRRWMDERGGRLDLLATRAVSQHRSRMSTSAPYNQ